MRVTAFYSYGSYVPVMQIVKIQHVPYPVCPYSKRVVHYQPRCTIPHCSRRRVEFGAQWDVEIRDIGNKSYYCRRDGLKSLCDRKIFKFFNLK